MLIVVIVGRWSDYSACSLVHDFRLYSVLDTVVSMFSGIWSKLLMISAISCFLWSSVCECQRLECGLTSPVRTECGTTGLTWRP